MTRTTLVTLLTIAIDSDFSVFFAFLFDQLRNPAGGKYVTEDVVLFDAEVLF